MRQVRPHLIWSKATPWTVIPRDLSDIRWLFSDISCFWRHCMGFVQRALFGTFTVTDSHEFKREIPSAWGQWIYSLDWVSSLGWNQNIGAELMVRFWLLPPPTGYVIPTMWLLITEMCLGFSPSMSSLEIKDAGQLYQASCCLVVHDGQWTV